MATSMGRKRRRGVAVLGAVAALTIYLVGAAVPANAAVSCAVTGAGTTQTMTVTMSSNADAVTIDVSGANIEFNHTACTPVATTAAVSAIVVNADTLAEAENQTVTIDGTGGAFTASLDGQPRSGKRRCQL